MCIACLASKESILKKEDLDTAFKNNNQGAGFAYVDNNQLIIKKGYFDFEKFWEDFNSIQENRVTLVHFRVVSAGEKSVENCHPFEITDKLCFAMNGTITDFKIDKCKDSDTVNFNEAILKELISYTGEDFIFNASFYYIMDKLIGNSTKLVFLNSDEQSIIINPELGEYQDDKKIWWSNDSYKKLKTDKNKAKEDRNKSNPNHSTQNITYLHIESKGQNDKPFINRSGKHGKQRFGYAVKNGDKLLSDDDIQKLVKKVYKRKLKMLVKEGLIIRVPVDIDNNIISNQPKGQTELNMWLSKREVFNAMEKQEPLETCIL